MAKSPKAELKPVFATRSDIENALNALTSGGELRLEKYARYRIRALGRAAQQRDYEDLLSEAMTATVIGAEYADKGRHWRVKDVTFVKHLIEAMRSIASKWEESFSEDEPFLDSELAVETGESAERSPIAAMPTMAPGPEREVIAKQQLDDIYRHFQDDENATLVLDGWKEGMTGPEIVELGIDSKDYEAAVKRIRYHVRAGHHGKK